MQPARLGPRAHSQQPTASSQQPARRRQPMQTRRQLCQSCSRVASLSAAPPQSQQSQQSPGRRARGRPQGRVEVDGTWTSFRLRPARPGAWGQRAARLSLPALLLSCCASCLERAAPCTPTPTPCRLPRRRAAMPPCRPAGRLRLAGACALPLLATASSFLSRVCVATLSVQR